MAGSVLLLSVRPEYAAMIFAGTKGVELRKVRPQVTSGDTVMVYVTAPVKALSGTVTVDRVVAGKPSFLWRLVRGSAGLSRQEFERYYAGVPTGYVIVFSEARRLPSSVDLEALRSLWEGFQPPRTYAYLTASELRAVRALSGRGSAGRSSISRRSRTLSP